MLSKVDVVRQLYEQTNKKIPMKDLDTLVDKVFDIISDSLTKGEDVQIAGFGTFALSDQMKKPVVKIKKVVNKKK
jgi:nucleoid DNA-binding protein